MTLPNTDAHILATFRKHEAHAALNTPGGVLFRRDLAGIYRTVAGIHGVTVGRVKEVVPVTCRYCLRQEVQASGYCRKCGNWNGSVGGVQ